MKFCSRCGSPTRHDIPEGDNRKRYICDNCNLIHYQNPNIVAGTIAISDDKVLLCRRAIEPRRGFWGLPAGFMENGETTPEAALRETREEAEAELLSSELYCIFDLPHINQVHMFFRGPLKDGTFGVGVETLESALFSEADIPWHDIAFPTVYHALKFYFEERKSGHFTLHHHNIADLPTQPV